NAAAFKYTPEKLKDLPIVGDVRGEGFFYGIELVKDKDTKESFTEEESERILKDFVSAKMYEGGLYCRADDRGDPVIQLSPPLTVGQSEFDEMEQIIRGVLTEAWTKLGPRPRATDGGPDTPPHIRCPGRLTCLRSGVAGLPRPRSQRPRSQRPRSQRPRSQRPRSRSSASRRVEGRTPSAPVSGAEAPSPPVSGAEALPESSPPPLCRGRRSPDLTTSTPRPVVSGIATTRPMEHTRMLTTSTDMSPRVSVSTRD